MHMKYLLKSNKLIIGILAITLFFAGFSYIHASDSQLIAFLYVKDNCAKCSEYETLVNNLIKDSNYTITIKNTSDDTVMDEYKGVVTNCELSGTPYPLYLSENGCLTDKQKIQTDIEDLIELYSTVDDSMPTTDDTSAETDTEQTDKVEENSAQTPTTVLTTTSDNTVDPFNPWLLILSLGIAGFMFWSGFYIIKEFKL